MAKQRPPGLPPDDDAFFDSEGDQEDGAYDESRRDELRRQLRLCERDRKQIALELHDGCAQQLSAAIMYLDLAVSQLPAQPHDALTSSQEALRRVRSALQEMRDVIAGVHPPALQQYGLATALRELTSRDSFLPLQIDLELNVSQERLLPAQELAVYRIVQEALRNVQRHSRSERARVRLSNEHGRIVIEVQDFGRGFEREQVPLDRLGLAGLEERAALAGGRCEITSVVGSGTTVRAVLPCPRSTDLQGD